MFKLAAYSRKSGVNTVRVRLEAKIWLQIGVHASRMKAASHAI
jgi:hypothetical protein